jgi:hypothetical protein
LENGICSAQIMSTMPEKFEKLNLISKWYLNITAIHCAIVNTYFKLDSIKTEDLPLRGFQEMLVIASSIYFEQNPRENFWKLDEFIGKWFIPLCNQFASKNM